MGKPVTDFWIGIHDANSSAPAMGTLQSNGVMFPRVNGTTMAMDSIRQGSAPHRQGSVATSDSPFWHGPEQAMPSCPHVAVVADILVAEGHPELSAQPVMVNLMKTAFAKAQQARLDRQLARELVAVGSC